MKMRPDRVLIMTVSIAQAAARACGIKCSEATPSIRPDTRLNTIWMRVWVMLNNRGKPLPRSEAANSAVPYSASSDVSVMILASHQIVAVNQLFFATVAQH